MSLAAVMLATISFSSLQATGYQVSSLGPRLGGMFLPGFVSSREPAGLVPMPGLPNLARADEYAAHRENVALARRTPTNVFTGDPNSCPCPLGDGSASTGEEIGAASVGAQPEGPFEVTDRPPSQAAPDPAQHTRPVPTRPGVVLSPIEYLPIFQEAAAKFNIPVEILLAIGQIESDFQPYAVGPYIPFLAGTRDQHALGMMQFLPSTFESYKWASGSPNPDIFEARDAIFAAAAYLAASGFNRDPVRAIWAYNHDYDYVDHVLWLAEQHVRNPGQVRIVNVRVRGGRPNLAALQARNDCQGRPATTTSAASLAAAEPTATRWPTVTPAPGQRIPTVGPAQPIEPAALAVQTDPCAPAVPTVTPTPSPTVTPTPTLEPHMEAIRAVIDRANPSATPGPATPTSLPATPTPTITPRPGAPYLPVAPPTETPVPTATPAPPAPTPTPGIPAGSLPYVPQPVQAPPAQPVGANEPSVLPTVTPVVPR
ncbi:MAG: transglycosylase SLT domain-containing protein [Chloroflexi bacterium]|nr:transglycosylase SLT domain-containing protein [Chloroflexota bacterium]